ncbi:MAG: glycosyltransferase [Deltaproteobacteria bacterium]|nr:glycosyltransferase [Deltaproteobacteria bacterium]
MTRPTLSVLLPVRDGARHLPAALRSLQAQSVPADEVIAVDDRSADATRAVLLAWSGRLPLRIVHGRGRGIAAALNDGLAACRGEWVARMDADDVMHPHRLREQLRYARAHPDADVVGCEVVSFPPSRVSPKRAAYDAWISSLHTPEEHARDLYVEAPLAHPTVTLRRAVLGAVGGYQDVRWPEDYDLWLRLHAAGARMGKPHGVLHFWREHPDRLSRTHADYTRDAIRRCRLHHLAAHMDLRRRGVVVVGAGLEGKAAGRTLIDEGVAVLGHVDADPRKVGGRLAGEGGVRVHPPGRLRELLGAPSQPVAVVAIGTAGARAGLRRELAEQGLREGHDAVVVA